MNKRNCLSFISALTLVLTSLPFTYTYAAAEDKTTANTASEESKNADPYYIFYNDIDQTEINKIIAEKVHDHTYSLYEQGLTDREVEIKAADYSQEIRLSLLKEAYKNASARIIRELGVDENEVFCSGFTPMIVCSLTDTQLEAAKKSENIKEIAPFSDFTLAPQIEFTDKDGFIEFFTTDSSGKPVLSDDVKLDAVFNSGKNKNTDYLIVYGLSDISEIDKTVDKLNKNSRFTWSSAIDTFSGSIFYTNTAALPTENNTELIVFADDVLPGFTGNDPARYSEEVGFDVKPYISFLGDTNDDLKLNASDASAILAAYAKAQTSDDNVLSETDIKKMDVDGNNTVDAVDASYILSYYAYTSTGGSGSLKDFLKNRDL